MRSRRPAYASRYREIHEAIEQFERTVGLLPGIEQAANRHVFIEQIIDSEQRVRYFEMVQGRHPGPASADPGSPDFHPLKAAVMLRDAGQFDEAVWLVFIYVHFGRHVVAGWRYSRDIYGRLGQGPLWDWEATSSDPTLFRFWLDDNMQELQRQGPRGFGNHRKYESLNAWEPTGTGEAVFSYVSWVLDGFESHEERFKVARDLGPEVGFDQLYNSMRRVRRFGRIARFDYLTTLKRLELLDVRPAHTYLVGATGPLKGARLLLEGEGSTMSAREAQRQLVAFTTVTGVAPDVLEDAVCNWQKDPAKYVRFSG